MAGSAMLVSSGLLSRRGIYGWEVAIFQAINGLPGNLRPFLWVLNQYGTVLTIPLATIVALLFRRWLLAVSLAVSGIAVYVLAKVVKEYVARGRPAALLGGVVERETFSSGSLGYPSGHAAVAWAITLILLPHVSQPWRTVAIVLAMVVPLSRMYVGAHLPLDLIGGAALGVTAASAVNLLVGVRVLGPADDTRVGPAQLDRYD